MATMLSKSAPPIFNVLGVSIPFFLGDTKHFQSAFYHLSYASYWKQIEDLVYCIFLGYFLRNRELLLFWTIKNRVLYPCENIKRIGRKKKQTN